MTWAGTQGHLPILPSLRAQAQVQAHLLAPSGFPAGRQQTRTPVMSLCLSCCLTRLHWTLGIPQGNILQKMGGLTSAGYGQTTHIMVWLLSLF